MVKNFNNNIILFHNSCSPCINSLLKGINVKGYNFVECLCINIKLEENLPCFYYKGFYKKIDNFVKEIIKKEKSDKEVYLCAVVDGSIIGIGSLNQKGQNKIRHRAEFGMAIEEDFWGIGIGRALAMSCIECAKNAGYLQLELEVASENSKAIALYESIGFVEFGRNPRGFISRYKGWQELVSMRLELN